MPQFLLEFLTEDIPARMQVRAADDLKRLFLEALKAEGLSHGAAEAYVTPRRLALVVDGLPAATEAREEEKRGPRVGAPDKAIQGFLRGNGLESLDQCEAHDTGKGEFWFFVHRIPGRDTAAVLPDLITRVADAMPWPKSMRWGAHQRRWVRPLRAVMAIFDGAPLQGALDLGDDAELIFSGETVGHRFTAPEAFAPTDFESYEQGLEARHVILRHERRQALIFQKAHTACAAKGVSLVPDPGLLAEVAGLVEWPVAYLGRIDADFMDLPDEVRRLSMRTHQKYFATQTEDGASAPYFVVIANVETADEGKAVIDGNEKVLRARLADARFFWDQDRKKRLEDRLPDLAAVTFHKKLGSMLDKAERLEQFARQIAPNAKREEYMGQSNPSLCSDTDAARAGRLAKADLTTQMVYEFPELQGYMGGQYAAHDREDASVAQAIAEHYRPQGPGDDVPQSDIGKAVALADKLDTLAKFFSIGEKPTGSSDPFALRRAALGVIRILTEAKIRLSLRSALYYANLSGEPRDDLLAFFADRLKVFLRDHGVRHDLIDAVFALGEDDLVRLVARVDALLHFLKTEDGGNLLAGYKRAANIVRIEAKKDGRRYDDGEADRSLMREEAETALAEALVSARKAIAPLLAAEQFEDCMTELAKLRAPIDRFFDDVTVNADDPALRENRLRLLAEITATINQIAHFAKVEG